MAHSAVRTSAGARNTTFPVSRASSRSRAALVFSFSFVAMVPVSFVWGLSAQCVRDSIFHILEKSRRNPAHFDSQKRSNRILFILIFLYKFQLYFTFYAIY